MVALAQALKNAPPDLDTVPGRSLLVFGTYDHSECTCNLRYIGFPNDVSAIMSTPSYMYKPSPALLEFLDDEFDYCIEENIRLTREEALCLRPVLKALKMPGLGRKGEIWYCGTDIVMQSVEEFYQELIILSDRSNLVLVGCIEVDGPAVSNHQGFDRCHSWV
jgi:hypothetical protein